MAGLICYGVAKARSAITELCPGASVQISTINPKRRTGTFPALIKIIIVVTGIKGTRIIQ